KSPDNGVDPNQLPPENTANAQVATDSDASSDMPVTEESASPSEPSPLIVDNIDPAPADAQKKTFQSQAVQLFLKLNRKQKVSVFLVLGLIIIGVFGPDTGSQVSSQNTSQRSTSQDTPSLDISENHARLA